MQQLWSSSHEGRTTRAVLLFRMESDRAAALLDGYLRKDRLLLTVQVFDDEPHYIVACSGI